ncbi:MAG: NUDIX hydrolase [Burkholderiales bacterium]
MKYCSTCGGLLARRIPPDDNLPRAVCDACGTIHYENPKMVVGCIPEWGDKILLCRRAIEPRYGLWTVPAGYLENGETTGDGAMRETLEEAGARVELLEPYAIYNIPHISQVYLLFRARLKDSEFAPGTESLEVKLFEESDIPWDEIAFATVRNALHRYFSDRRTGQFPMHVGTIQPLPAQAKPASPP